jgi:hypothetical protein
MEKALISLALSPGFKCGFYFNIYFLSRTFSLPGDLETLEEEEALFSPLFEGCFKKIEDFKIDFFCHQLHVMLWITALN